MCEQMTRGWAKNHLKGLKGTILSAYTGQGIGSVLISQSEKPHNLRTLGRVRMLKNFASGVGKNDP